MRQFTAWPFLLLFGVTLYESFVNVADVFGVDVSCDVVSFVDDEEGFPALVKIMRDDCAGESCSCNEIIIHVLFEIVFSLIIYHIFIPFRYS